MSVADDRHEQHVFVDPKLSSGTIPSKPETDEITSRLCCRSLVHDPLVSTLNADWISETDAISPSGHRTSISTSQSPRPPGAASTAVWGQ